MAEDNPLRKLPAVNDILACPQVVALASRFGHEQIVEAIRSELAVLRTQLQSKEATDGCMNAEALAARVVIQLEQGTQALLRTVINGTGIVLHTNLGRAPMAEAAARAAYEAARGYLNLELDLHTGKRSSRQNPIREWITRLTGAESATAVNNNAAATVLVLRALCQGREVIVSRGQLIEIGGSFRIPEIMAVSGAILREVGTTNITRISDYQKAIGLETGALLRVHSSNYRVSGFTESVPLTELVALGKKHGLPVIDDVGSGALLDFARFGFNSEPVVSASVRSGADLVLFSGDKLLGGPQAGIIAGRKEFIQQIEKDPLMRAFRLDKMTLAALESTLRIYLNQEQALREVPVLRLLGLPLAALRERAESLAVQLRAIPGLAQVTVMEDVAFVGGGSLPDQTMKTVVLAVQAADISDVDLACRLRTGTPAVVGRLQEGMLLLDLRTVLAEQETLLLDCVRAAVV